VRAWAELEPVRCDRRGPATWILDFGQNFAGVVRIRVRGQRGHRIRLRHAEILNPDGSLHVANLRSARATDTYVCRGSGVETWEPRFTCHGFRYVEISGLEEAPEPGSIIGVALGSDTPRSGEFHCSDELVNRLMSNVWWTQRANFLEVPTDCPQRDERLGWTGDAQVYIGTAGLLADVESFFEKWLVDLADAQRADGQFPMVAPLRVAGDDGGPGWADAGVICPWTLFELYGDRGVLERHYEGMTRFIEFCRRRSTGDLLPPESFHCFGDWVSVDAPTPKDVICTAYFAQSTNLVARAAEALGRSDDARRYRDLAARIGEAFNRAYVDDVGRIRGDTQCAYALALSFGLLEGERRQGAARRLVEKIAERGGHLSTGFLGTRDLLPALSANGHHDLACALLHQESYPSWGFQINNGATSIWERWNGWTPEQGVADPGMNSFAHYAFGAVGQWIFETLGGIRPELPGFERISIRPEADPQLSWARASYDSIRGRIATEWRRSGDSFELDVLIPPNTTATVAFPSEDPDAIEEGGLPWPRARGVRLLGTERKLTLFEVGSGRYRFSR
jgi:alpha-L-rhamnosidase